MQIAPIGLTIPQVTHHRMAVNGTQLHVVAAGAGGSPILLVHGFPESWWAFHTLIPLLAQQHRVFAVDLRGFGDSNVAGADDTSATVAEDLHSLVGQIGLGPVHLVVQDISGTAGFRLASTHPEDVISFTAIETGIAGHGIEMLADVGKGGAWYIGALATPGVPEAFLKGRARELFANFIFRFATAAPDAVKPADLTEFARGYEHEGGWSGSRALYGSMLREGDEIKALAASKPFTVPTLVIDRAESDFTFQSINPIHAGEVRRVSIQGAGHYIALEKPTDLAAALLGFVADVDAGQ